MRGIKYSSPYLKKYTESKPMGISFDMKKLDPLYHGSI